MRVRQEHESTKLSKKKKKKKDRKRRQKPRFLESDGSCHMTETLGISRKAETDKWEEKREDENGTRRQRGMVRTEKSYNMVETRQRERKIVPFLMCESQKRIGKKMRSA